MKKQIFSFGAVALFLISSFMLLLQGCQRDLDAPGGGTTGPVVDDNVMITAGLRGTVIDENSQPVTGATVTSGTSTTTTDKYGVFRFSNISLSKANAYVKVSKAGYFTGMRTFISTAARVHNVRIRLLPKSNTGTFTASVGGTVTLAGGGKLVMGANAVVDAGGAAYSGIVNVAMTWIDPTASNLPEIMVGDFRGVTTAGEERGLETYGMLGVEMTTPGGQALKIAPGKTAELTFPIPASMPAAPATIDLWHFDEVKGRWLQEGSATKTGNNYIANVSHFSFWNCDAPFPLINLCITVVGPNNQPLNNVQVRIRRTNNSYASGWTDSIGNLCGKVPKNEALVLQVMDQCNNVVYSQNIGPFSADANLGTVTATIPPANILTITGTVTTCAGTNVTNGAVIIYTNAPHSYTLPVTNGTFSLNIIRCNSATVNFSVVGIDVTALQQSLPVSGSGTSGTVNVGAIQACGTTPAEFAEFIVDGVAYHFVSPPDNFMGGDSTGVWGIYTNKTDFHGYRSQNGGTTLTGSFGLIFLNNQATGTLPIEQGFFLYGTTVQTSQFVATSPVVNITAFGPMGGFIEGNFSQMMIVTGIPKMVNCNFRVRR